MKELFEKIYIKSNPNNLPEKDGEYYFGWDINQLNINAGIDKVKYTSGDCAESLINLSEAYEWYLQPISQPDQGVTEDEINNVISRHGCHLEFYQQVYLVEELHSLFQSRNTVDLRSEHVKLITWVFDNWDNSMTDGKNEAVVDKYLASRK